MTSDHSHTRLANWPILYEHLLRYVIVKEKKPVYPNTQIAHLCGFHL